MFYFFTDALGSLSFLKKWFPSKVLIPSCFPVFQKALLNREQIKKMQGKCRLALPTRIIFSLTDEEAAYFI